MTLNGEAAQVPPGLSIRGLLEHVGVPVDRVAVELDRAIVRKAEWELRRIEPGAKLEIVEFVGGG